VPEVLAAEDMLLREKGSAVRELFDIRMAEAGLEIEPVWESVSTRALVRAVRENMGISVLPYYLVEEDIRRGEVKAVAVERVDFTREFSIVYHRNKYHSEAFDAFVRICSGGVETEREKD
jgi:DNA-binding transcriptional LysR family regulator